MPCRHVGVQLPRVTGLTPEQRCIGFPAGVRAIDVVGLSVLFGFGFGPVGGQRMGILAPIRRLRGIGGGRRGGERRERTAGDHEAGQGSSSSHSESPCSEGYHHPHADPPIAKDLCFARLPCARPPRSAAPTGGRVDAHPPARAGGSVPGRGTPPAFASRPCRGVTGRPGGGPARGTGHRAAQQVTGCLPADRRPSSRRRSPADRRSGWSAPHPPRSARSPGPARSDR